MITHSTDDLHYINTVQHQGKLIQFGVKPISREADEEPAGKYYGAIYYSILETGQQPQEEPETEEAESDLSEEEAINEDTVSITNLEIPGGRWSGWKLLSLPNQPEDASVIDQELAEAEVYWEVYAQSLAEEDRTEEAKAVYVETQPPVCSRYRTSELGAFTPVQMVSSDECLYVFRQSLYHTLYADRFILDGITNELIPKLEVRFKRSGQRLTPLKVAKNGQEFDSLDYKDANGNPFYEPTKEIKLFDLVRDGLFSVALTPTYEHEKHCWHIFYHCASGDGNDHLELYSIRRSKAGWFDLNDYTVAEGDAEQPDLRLVPGIIQRKIALQDDSGQPISIVDGFAATVYTLQDSALDANGEEILVKTGMRLMLAFPSSRDRKIAALSFSIHRDGTLSRISDTPTTETQLREIRKTLILPGDLLNQVQSVAGKVAEPPPNNDQNGLTFSGEERIEITDPFKGKALKNFTLSCWLKPGLTITDDRSYGFFGGNAESPGKVGMALLASGELGYVVFDSSGTAHGGILSTNQFTNEAGDTLEEPISSEDEWVHIAWVKKGEEFTFYRNGVFTAQTAAPAVIEEGEGPFCFGTSGDGDTSLQGEMAGVTIWQRALDQDRIPDLMDQSLLGSEVDLVGYWPLQGIVDGKTTDFSPENNHGIVYGPYPAGSQFSALMSDGMTSVEYFRNPEMVAVTKGATYLESVEYQLVTGSDADVLAPIDLRVWGTQGRNGERSDISPAYAETEALNDGWNKLTVRYTIPEGVSHLRYFEIASPEGAWSKLKLRKHAIAQITHTVTRSTYEEVLPLESLGDASGTEVYTDLNAARVALTGLEEEETTLLQRLAYLDYVLDNDDPENALYETLSSYEELVGPSGTITQEMNDLEATYLSELDNPYNYYCSFRTKDPNRSGQVIAFSNNNNRDIKGYTPASHKAYKWKLKPYSDNSYIRLQSRDYPDLYMTRISGKLDIQAREYKGGEARQQWVLKKGWGYSIVSRNEEDKCVHLYSKNGNIYRENYGGYTNQRWDIITHEACNNVVAKAKDAYEDKVEEWNLENDKYLQAQADLAADIDQLAVEREEILETLLPNIQESITAINTQFLEQARALNTAPLVADNTLTDQNGLTSSGVLLDFASCSGRLTAYESLEGKVQLDSFSGTGTIQSVCYDAVSEEWKPNMLFSCLNFSGTDDMVTAENLVDFPNEEITLEWWFKTQEAKPSGTFISYLGPDPGDGATYRDSLKIIDAADGLTINLNGAPLNTGLQLHDAQWHHLALTFYTGDLILRVYVDGIEQALIDLQAILENSPEVQAIIDSNPEIDSYRDVLAGMETITPGGTLYFGQAMDQDGNAETEQAYSGKLAEVRLWSTVLTADELAAQRHLYLSGFEPDLVAYWPMNEAEGDVLNDHSQHDAVATIVNGTSWYAGTMPIGNLPREVLQLDGATQYLSSSHEIDLSGEYYTIEFWVKRGDLTEDDQLICSIGTGEDGQGGQVGLRGDGNIYWHNSGHATAIEVATDSNDQNWHHYMLTFDKVNEHAQVYIDGELKLSEPVDGAILFANSGWLYLGCRGWDKEKFFGGQLADFRIWGTIRTAEQLTNQYKKRLSGKEFGLLYYCPLDSFDANLLSTTELVTGNHLLAAGEWRNTRTTLLSLAPADALNSGEYSALQTDRQGVNTAMLRRVYLFGGGEQVQILASKRLEELEKRWLGNAQFAPTLLGYMEGAPPIPSENLTVDADYRGATNVELKLSEETVYRWNRNQQAGLGWQLNGGYGWASSTSVGGSIGVASASETVSSEFLTIGELNGSYSWLHESDISTAVTLGQNDRLDLKGEMEQTAAIPEIGKRFVPKNVGYAVVVSSLADVFVFRLKKSGRMVGYEVSPVPDIEPDINTITFMMNPAYTMNGSLDGQVGMQAADETFYRHVPDMRAQYGSLYPASYYRLKEAYALKEMIRQEDADREALYMNYPSTRVDEAAIDDYAGKKKVDEGDAEDSLEEIDHNAPVTSSNSADELEGWQRRMEDLALNAQKRNIVNTYVWDGDGGLRSETQQMATSLTQTIGGSFSMDGGLGITGSLKGGSLGFEMSFMATFHLTQTMKKSETKNKGFGLDVKVDCENRSITDQNDLPLLPGQKVDRYRFMSFYLEPKTDNFNHFFAEVVDPEWLISNDEEARALRQIDRTKPNKTWKVMHRVTYVERPALGAF